MNSATKFLVMILFIGVLCTDVGARKLVKVSKELMDQKPLTLPLPLPPMSSVLPMPLPPVPLPVPISGLGARKLVKVSKELMDQKPLTLPPMSPMLPIPLPPVPLPVPISGLGEAVSATKGGRVENGVGMLSKETKLGISIPKTAATNGVGTELVLTVTSRATRVINANDNAVSSPGGPGSSATGRTYVSTSGTVTVDGPNPSAYSTSVADRQAGADAESGPDGAESNGSSNGYAYTRAGGSVGNSTP